MDKGHDLRRTIEKLRILQENPYIKQILSDMIEFTGAEYFDGETVYFESDKEWFIEQLERTYKEFIKNNTTENAKQGKLL